MKVIKIMITACVVIFSSNLAFAQDTRPSSDPKSFSKAEMAAASKRKGTIIHTLGTSGLGSESSNGLGVFD